MTGTRHISVCGCLKSPPRPDGRTLAGREWRKAWTAKLAEHHTACCQARQYTGWLRVCMVGDQENCPQIRPAVEYEPAAHDQGWRCPR